MNDKVKQILDSTCYITLATITSDGRPWNTPLYSIADENLTFYWFSDKNSVHSQNISANGKGFLVVYDTTAPEGTGEGLYVEADVSEITENEEKLHAIRTLDSRSNTNYSAWGLEKFSKDSPLRLYKAVYKRIWLNGDEQDEQGNYIKDIRTKIKTA